MKVRIIVNRGGGSADEARLERLRTAFEREALEAEIRLVESRAIGAAFREARDAKGLEAAVAAGGDGTVNAAAAALAGGNVPLGIVPMGTLNHFARDAGLPADPEAAAAVIAGGHVARVDVGEVNGRIFVNNSAIGLYPRFVREREAQRRRLGRSRRLAMLLASLRGLRQFRHRRLTIRVAGRDAPIETCLLFVGNNHYDTSLLTLGRRTRLDGGEMCIYAVLTRTRLHLLGLALRGLVGRLDQQRDFVSLDGMTEAEILSPRPLLAVATDGETHYLETPLRYRTRPAALPLFVPD